MQKSVIKQLSATLVLLASFAFTSGNLFADETLVTGEFTGKSDHITTGAVTIKKVANGYIVELGNDFSLDGAPDPKVGFGKDGEYKATAQLGHLASNTGKQIYVIPANLDVSDFNEIYIWCEKFSVPLGVAALK